MVNTILMFLIPGHYSIIPAKCTGSMGPRGLDIFSRLGYNKSIRRCPLVTGTSPWWSPRRLPRHISYRVRVALSDRKPSVAADGLLLLIVQVQYERHNTGNGAQSSKDSKKCRSYMYRLPRNEFPVRAIHRLHSALTGWQATVF